MIVVLGRRQANGRPLGVIGSGGLAPTAVTNLNVGMASSTTLPVTFTAASGSALIAYSGFTSPHGSSTWTQNSASFTSTGGTFVGLAPSTSYDLRIVASNAYGLSTTDNLVGSSTSTASATSFSVALSTAGGAPSAPVQILVTPSSGAWPSGEVITPSVTGLAGSFDNASLIGTGKASVVFNFTPVSAPGTLGSFNVSATGMLNSSGAQSYAITAVSASGTANRFDALFPVSATTIGTAQTLSISPNGAWPPSAGSITLAVSKGTGNFPDGATANYSPASTTPVAIRYQPTAAGEHAIRCSNTAALYAPYPSPLNVFAVSSGTAQTITANLVFGDQAAHQRDTVSGNPSGFSFSWARGWGEVPINITALGGATNCLWIKLVDALSSGATTMLGTGTYLNAAPVQVYGPLSGTGRLTLLLPAGPYHYFAEIATDAAFTNPIRLANRFSVGVVFGVASRSFECGVGQAYAQSGGAVSTTYAKAVTFGSYDYRYPADSGWFRNDGVSGDPYQYHYGNTSSSGSMELGRIVEAQLGVVCGIAGMLSSTGGGLDQFVGHDGSLSYGFQGTMSYACGGKFRYFWGATNSWDGVDSNYPTESLAENRIRYKAAVDWIARNYPACAVIGWCSASGIFGGDGSRPEGFTRNTCIFLNEIEPVNPMVVSKETYNWNEYANNHATMAARMQYVRSSARLIFATETAAMGGNQTQNRGPTLSASATISSGSRVIRFPFKLHGGTALQGVKILFNNSTFSYNPASAGDIASLFALYPSGGYAGAAGTPGKTIKITGAAINATAPPPGADGTIDVTLAGASGITYGDGTTDVMPSTMTAHFASDFGQSTGGVPAGEATVLCDDRTDFGIGMGWHMRPKQDIMIKTV